MYCIIFLIVLQLHCSVTSVTVGGTQASEVDLAQPFTWRRSLRLAWCTIFIKLTRFYHTAISGLQLRLEPCSSCCSVHA